MKIVKIVIVVILALTLGGSLIGAYIYYKDKNANLDDTPNGEIIIRSVTFETFGGSLVKTQKILDGGKITEVPTSMRVGYTFLNWCKDENLLTPWDFSTDRVTKDTTLFAAYTKNKYNLSFEIFGGIWNETFDQFQNKEYQSSIIRPTQNPTRDNFNFVNWYTNEDFTQLFNFTQTMPAYSVVIYAKWSPIETPPPPVEPPPIDPPPTEPTDPPEPPTEPIEPPPPPPPPPPPEPTKYQITFNANGGASTQVLLNPAGTILLAPQNPTRSGFVFWGWVTQRYGGSSTRISFPYTTKAQNETFYAYWQYVFETPTSVSGNISLQNVTATYNNNISKTQPMDFIANQNNYSAWKYDGATLNGNGCGIIGVYNAFLHLGIYLNLAELIRWYEQTGGNASNYLAQFGFASSMFDVQSFGTMPEHVITLANLIGVQCVSISTESDLKTRSNQMTQSQSMVISIWNAASFGFPNFQKGAHTMGVTKTADGQFQIYNSNRIVSNITDVYKNGLLFNQIGPAAFILG